MFFFAMRVGVAILRGGFRAALLRGRSHLFAGRRLPLFTRGGREHRREPLELAGTFRALGRCKVQTDQRFERVAARAAAEVEERHADNVSCFHPNF